MASDFTCSTRHCGPAPADSVVGFQHVCLSTSSPEELTIWRTRWIELYQSGDYDFAFPDQPTYIDVDSGGVRSFYTLDVNGLESNHSRPQRRHMNMDTGPVLSHLPSGDGWDLGGFPYGLEPGYACPRAGSGERSVSSIRPISPTMPITRRACAYCTPIEDVRCRRNSTLRRTDELFWFRWITGHQVSFIIWP